MMRASVCFVFRYYSRCGEIEYHSQFLVGLQSYNWITRGPRMWMQTLQSHQWLIIAESRSLFRNAESSLPWMDCRLCKFRPSSESSSEDSFRVNRLCAKNGCWCASLMAFIGHDFWFGFHGFLCDLRQIVALFSLESNQRIFFWIETKHLCISRRAISQFQRCAFFLFWKTSFHLSRHLFVRMFAPKNVHKASPTTPRGRIQIVKQTYADGSTYEGGYLNFKKQGKGIISFANGEKYDGQWTEGSKEGSGVYTWADGSHYTGNWHSDRMCGEGVHVSSNGSKYEGSWADNVMHGCGSYEYDNGSLYKGEWYQGYVDSFYHTSI